MLKKYLTLDQKFHFNLFAGRLKREYTVTKIENKSWY